MAKQTTCSATLFNNYYPLHQRYSNYPADSHFQQPISAFERYNVLRASQAAQRPLSLNISIPFCANACLHCAKKPIITKDRSRSTAYLQALEQEINLVSQHIDKQRSISNLHLTGGTPTFLNAAELRQIMQCLQSHFTILSDNFSHYSIDIDPRETDWATMGLLRDIGFNHINILVHALDPDVQRAINRLHSLEHTQTIIDAARTLQFHHVSVSLTYGLPKQSPECFTRSLKDIARLVPDRIIVQNFQHQPAQHPIQKRIDPATLPSTQACAQMLQNAFKELHQVGYQYLGLGNFALADDAFSIAQEDHILHQSIQGYSTQPQGDTLGFGVAAISQLGTLYYRNTQELTDYQNAGQQRQLPPAHSTFCSEDRCIRQSIIQALNCQFYCDFNPIEQRYGICIQDYFHQLWPQLQHMQCDGLITLTPHSLEITTAGRLLTLAVCQLFSATGDIEPAALLKCAKSNSA